MNKKIKKIIQAICGALVGGIGGFAIFMFLTLIGVIFLSIGGIGAGPILRPHEWFINPILKSLRYIIPTISLIFFSYYAYKIDDEKKFRTLIIQATVVLIFVILYFIWKY